MKEILAFAASMTAKSDYGVDFTSGKLAGWA